MKRHIEYQIEATVCAVIVNENGVQEEWIDENQLGFPNVRVVLRTEDPKEVRQFFIDHAHFEEEPLDADDLKWAALKFMHDWLEVQDWDGPPSVEYLYDTSKPSDELFAALSEMEETEDI